MGAGVVGRLSVTVLWLLAWLHYALPRFGREAVSGALGGVLRVLRLRSRVVGENLRIAYAGDSPELRHERERVFRESYRSFGRLVFEILYLLGPMKRHVRRSTALRGLEHWQEATRQGRGVIFLASHVGNWEVMAATGAIRGGMDLMLVTKHLKPEWLHQAIEEGRLHCGVRGTYEPRTLKDVLGHLKRNGTVGIVLDQYTGPPIGVRVPVFGQPVGTSTVVAMLAKRTGAAVLPVSNHLAPDGRRVVEIEPEIPWIGNQDANLELALNTAEYARVLERHIRAHPGEWLWIHRRFKGDLKALREGEWMEGRPRR